MDQSLSKHYKEEKEALNILGYFAIVTFFISCLGLIGVVS